MPCNCSLALHCNVNSDTLDQSKSESSTIYHHRIIILQPLFPSSSSPPSMNNDDMDNLIIEEVEHKRVICYASNQDFTQELELFPELVWKTILGYVTDPNTISALLNTSPFFHQEMKKETGLLSLVLPHLMKNACLDLPNTLNCRLVNTTTKSTVDKTFKAIRIKKRPRGCNSSFFPPSPYTLPTYLNLEPFIRHFESLPTLTGNPFITDCLNLSVVSSLCYERVLEAVTRFGHLMKELELTMDRIYHPTTLMNRLIRFLTCVPNLERLQFRFAGFPERIEIDVIDANHGMTTTDLGILYPVPAAATFPTLPRLSELEFIQMDRESESGVHRYPPFYSIKAAAREILTAYGSQLSVFKCGYELFEMDIPADFFTQQLSTLSELTIAGFENGDQFNSLARLADVQLPKLTRLSLEIMGENLESSFWELLNNLRNSLEELYVWRRKADMPFEILHFDDFAPLPPVMVLPKLKLLTLEPPDLNLNMDGTFWPELQPRLTNLECLEFRVRNSLNSPKIESLPEIQVQNHFFGNFPILNQFIWKVRREDCVNTTVITRRDLKEGEQRVVSERIPYIQQWPRRLP